MIEFVNKQLALSRGRVTDPSFINIARGVNKNHRRIRAQYLNSSMAVKPTHVLLKLLSGLALTVSMTPRDIELRAEALTNQIAQSLRLTSPVSPGEGNIGDFMDAGHTSVLLHSDRFDADIPWYNLEPVVFRYHTNTNINYLLGCGDEASYAFVEVNVPMLAMQLYHWTRWRNGADVDESIRQFITKYPLFNAVKSYMDVSLLNRHYYQLTDAAIPEDRKTPQWPFISHEDAVDKSALKVVNQLLTGGKSIGQTLYSTAGFFTESALDRFQRPRVPRTNAVRWWDYATLLPMLHYGLTISSMSGYNVNQGILSNMDRDLVAFTNTRTLDKVPKHLSLHIMGNFIEPTRELIARLR